MIQQMTAFLAMLFLVLQAPTAHAQKAATATSNETDEKLEKTLLWKVTGKGIKPSYVFGTIHMIGADDFFWSDKMKKAFNKTDKLVMEIDMSQMLATSMQMLKLAPMNDNKQLKDLITAEEYDMVKTYFTEEASAQTKMTPFSMIENWKPMLVQSMLSTEMIEGPVKMYEMELTTMAQEREMNFGGLETVADQMEVFNTISYEAQAKILVETVANLKKGDTGSEDFGKLVDKYKEQDVDGMLEAMAGDLEEMDGQEALLDNRNRNWIPQIKEMSKKEKTFYAVGAGHLGGENGVIRLLRKEGFKVTPVMD